MRDRLRKLLMGLGLTLLLTNNRLYSKMQPSLLQFSREQLLRLLSWVLRKMNCKKRSKIKKFFKKII